MQTRPRLISMQQIVSRPVLPPTRTHYSFGPEAKEAEPAKLIAVTVLLQAGATGDANTGTALSFLPPDLLASFASMVLAPLVKNSVKDNDTHYEATKRLVKKVIGGTLVGFDAADVATALGKLPVVPSRAAAHSLVDAFFKVSLASKL